MELTKNFGLRYLVKHAPGFPRMYIANTKVVYILCTDQTVWMYGFVVAFTIHIWQIMEFSYSNSYMKNRVDAFCA